MQTHTIAVRYIESHLRIRANCERCAFFLLNRPDTKIFHQLLGGLVIEHRYVTQKAAVYFVPSHYDHLFICSTRTDTRTGKPRIGTEIIFTVQYCAPTRNLDHNGYVDYARVVAASRALRISLNGNPRLASGADTNCQSLQSLTLIAPNDIHVLSACQCSYRTRHTLFLLTE